MVHGRMKVVFLQEYNVSLAERLIPAIAVSNQIPTAKPADRQHQHEPETRAAWDLIMANSLSRNQPGTFDPIRDTLLTDGDHYMHPADLTSYVQAQDRLGGLHANPEAWARMAILNVANFGKFSSDRTIHEYPTEIWKAEPCPIP